MNYWMDFKEITTGITKMYLLQAHADGVRSDVIYEIQPKQL